MLPDGAPMTAQQARERRLENLVATLLQPFGVRLEGDGRKMVIVGIRRRFADEVAKFQAPVLKEMVVEACLYSVVVLMPLLHFLAVGCEAQTVYEATHLNATSLYHVLWDGQVNLRGDVYAGTQLYIAWAVALFSLSYVMLAFAKFPFYSGYARAKPGTRGGRRAGEPAGGGFLFGVQAALLLVWEVIATVFAWTYTASLTVIFSSAACTLLWLTAAVFVDSSRCMARTVE